MTSSKLGGNFCFALIKRGISSARSASSLVRYSSSWPLAAGQSGAVHSFCMHTQQGYVQRIFSKLLRSPMRVLPFTYCYFFKQRRTSKFVVCILSQNIALVKVILTLQIFINKKDLLAEVYHILCNYELFRFTVLYLKTRSHCRS